MKWTVVKTTCSTVDLEGTYEEVTALVEADHETGNTYLPWSETLEPTYSIEENHDEDL